MKKLTKNQMILMVLMTFLLIICLCSFFFFTELDQAHKGFLGVDVLKKIGFYDNSYTKYQGYWYSNGHLHPLYVASTDFFSQNYVIDCIFLLIVLIYCAIQQIKKEEILFNTYIIVLTIILFFVDFVGFGFAGYYCLVSNWTYPALQTFIIYVAKMLFFVSFIIFCFKNRKYAWED